MSDPGHVVCILTCADGPEQFDRLEQGLRQLALTDCQRCRQQLQPPPPARQQCSLRQALFARVEYLPLEQAEGRIAAQSVAPYPPGIPVIAPGEGVDKKLLAYLQKIGYNMPIAVIDPLA